MKLKWGKKADPPAAAPVSVSTPVSAPVPSGTPVSGQGVVPVSGRQSTQKPTSKAPAKKPKKSKPVICKDTMLCGHKLSKATVGEYEECYLAMTHEKRETWWLQAESVLSAIALTIGLGNIWRFPIKAYENGGSAFVLAYTICAFAVGLPMVYLEMVLGQYHQATLPIILRRICPLLAGFGWLSVIASGITAVYSSFIVIVYHVMMTKKFRAGDLNEWYKCGFNNTYNSTCFDMTKQDECRLPGYEYMLTYFNGSCVRPSAVTRYTPISAFEFGPELYFTKVMNMSRGFNDINFIKRDIFDIYSIMWAVTLVLAWKVVPVFGKATILTSVVPSLILMVGMVYGALLPGAGRGFAYIIGLPDVSKLIALTTWIEALKQLFYSLGIGYGAHVMLASFNKKSSNDCLRDATLVVVFNVVMHVVVGTSLMSTLGMMAAHTNHTVHDVIASTTNVTDVLYNRTNLTIPGEKNMLRIMYLTYADGMTLAPNSKLLTPVFFLSLAAIAIGAQVVLVQVGASAIADEIPCLGPLKHFVIVPFWGSILYAGGVILCTDAGLYWWAMFEHYIDVSFVLCTVVVEVIAVCYIYGVNHQMADMKLMFGVLEQRAETFLSQLNPYFFVVWSIFIPIIAVLLCVIRTPISIFPYFHDKQATQYYILGWVFRTSPYAVILLCALFYACRFLWKKKCPAAGMWRKQRQLRSFARVYIEMGPKARKRHENLPDREILQCHPFGFGIPEPAPEGQYAGGPPQGCKGHISKFFDNTLPTYDLPEPEPKPKPVSVMPTVTPTVTPSKMTSTTGAAQKAPKLGGVVAKIKNLLPKKKKKANSKDSKSKGSKASKCSKATAKIKNLLTKKKKKTNSKDSKSKGSKSSMGSKATTPSTIPAGVGTPATPSMLAQ